MTDIPYEDLMRARNLVSSNNLMRAFDMYLLAFNRTPRIKKLFRYEFHVVLKKVNEQLTSAGNITEIFDNFKKVFQVFPGDSYFLNEVGKELNKFGYRYEALCLFESVLNKDYSSVSTEKNLNHMKNTLFPQKQFRLLNDKRSNDAYREAIRSSVENSDIVLDMETTHMGLMSLYANESNPISVTATQSCKTMATLTERIIEDNNAQEVIVINKDIENITKEDIYGKKTVLVANNIDSGLFGDNILQCLNHALQNLLYENCKIIPKKAEYFVIGVESDELNNKYKLNQNMKNMLNIPNMNIHTLTDFGETYHSEDVFLFKNVKYMCEPKQLLSIDFSDEFEVHQKLHSHASYNVELVATENGEMNMFIGFFNLYLTNDIMLTSDPRSETRTTAWQQAIFFDILPRQIRPGESTNLLFRSSGGKLTSITDTRAIISRISSESLSYLNDTKYMDFVINSIASVCIHLNQTVGINRANILDFSPFPLFGMLMVRQGAESLICQVKTIEDEIFIRTVFATNGIPAEKVIILVAEDWSPEVFSYKTPHVVMSNFLNLNGDTDFRKVRFMQLLRYTYLSPGGLYLPSSVTVMGQLIYSDHFEINNKVKDDNVHYRVAKYMNQYQVSQAMYLDLSKLEYKALSAEFEVGSCEDMKLDGVKVRVSEDGHCNAIICWYKIQLLANQDEIHTNRNNSFIPSMAYMGSSATELFRGDEVTVLRCVDPDGAFKLVLDIEPN